MDTKRRTAVLVFLYYILLIALLFAFNEAMHSMGFPQYVSAALSVVVAMSGTYAILLGATKEEEK